jgi:non-specific serine/threonine protein kinase
MDPFIGKVVSHYRVEERLGSGGMGVVYRGRDLLLGRDVAIKVLPPPFAKDSSRVARLLREARLLAALNHPSIAAIYDLQRPRRSSPLLILEYVRGETLADLLREGPMPLREALEACGAIAGALEAAHRRGVIHRDIKPGNVMRTARGEVKVLDFGLARQTMTEEETSSGALSRPGAVLGTPGYMSPEQILAQPQDRRADAFGFGCVLYECLTGLKAFPGASVMDRLNAAVSRDPDWRALPIGTPESLRRILGRCLERDAALRLSDLREAREEIDALMGRRSESPTALLERHHLPTPLTSFVGREAQVREASDLLRRARLVTLTGIGGSGKTRLALRLAESVSASFPDGVWFVDLVPVADPSRVASAVVSVLAGSAETEGQPVTTLLGHLAAKRLLLVLDNCEHVLEACASLARELLERCRGLTILTTSREPLHVDGEQTYVVPPMEVPARDLPASQLERVDSVKLFVERARAANPRFSLSASEASAVAQICRSLDGIPLALELAAARVKLLSPVEIREMLQDRFRLLVGGAPSSRHATLAATFEWSHNQLDQEERRLFRALSVFAGSWTLEAAAFVAGPREHRLDVLQGMTRLVDKSLVLPEGTRSGETRCRYLETVREFALARLRAEGEESEARERHLAYFLELSERAATPSGPSQGERLARLESEEANLLSAFETATTAARNSEAALRLAAATWKFWLGRGHPGIREMLDTALGLPGSAGPSMARVKATIGAGALAFHFNDWNSGRTHFEDAIRVARELGYRAGEGHAIVGLASIRLGEGDHDGARALYEQSLALFEGAGEERGVGVALSNLGRTAELDGRLHEAWDFYQRGMEIFRKFGDLSFMALRLSSLGDLSLRLGRRDAAREHLLESLTLVQDLHEWRAAAFALARSAMLATEEGRLREAAILYGSAEALRERIGPVLTPEERVEDERRKAQARAKAGDDPGAFESSWREGRGLSFDDAVSFAITALTVTRSQEAPAMEPPRDA